jgi:hypothetical protein
VYLVCVCVFAFDLFLVFIVFFVFILISRHKSRESVKIGPHPRGHPSSQVGKDLSLVTCYKCGNKGHYANKCPEKYFRAPTEG